MYKIKENIPNFITLANLTCGLFAIIFAFQGSLSYASLCIFLGAFFDFFDGLTARCLKLNSEFGKQLDSMADMVTFGVAPGFILFHFIFYLQKNNLCHSMQENSFFSCIYSSFNSCFISISLQILILIIDNLIHLLECQLQC